MAHTIIFEPQSNRADFEQSWQALDENGEAIDLTGATITFTARDPQGGGETLSASTEGGEIVIDTTTFTISLGKSLLRNLCAKNYNVGCTIEQDGFTEQFFVGSLPIYDGVVP